MTEYDIQLLKIRLGQVRQDIEVDRVLAESRSILPEAQPIEPSRHRAHGGVLMAAADPPNPRRISLTDHGLE